MDSITVVCRKKPIDVPMRSVGELNPTSGCTAYSRSALLQTYSLVKSNYSSSNNDFALQIYVEYDCCENLDCKINMSLINLNTKFKHIVSHLDDLKIASHKVSQVEYMIKGQEDLPLCQLSTPIDEGKICRSSRLQTANLVSKTNGSVNWSSLKAEGVFYPQAEDAVHSMNWIVATEINLTLLTNNLTSSDAESQP
jgi:hypothetical protein